MFTINQFIQSIKTNLEKQSDPLTNNIRKVVSRNFSPDVDLLDFTIFTEPSRFELSVRMFSMDNEGNEVFDEEDQTAFAGSEEILPDSTYYELAEGSSDDFWDFYEQHDHEIAPEERQAFADWFYECWKKAGGDRIQFPSYLVFHDDSQSFDLKNAQWIDDEDKWF